MGARSLLSMISDTRDKRRIPRIRRWLPALLVLMLAQSATLYSSWSARRSVINASALQFASDSDALKQLLNDRMRAYAQMLRSASGFVSASGPPSRAQWQTFVAHLQLDTDYPGIQGVGYAKAIKPDEVAALEQEQQDAGRPDFHVHPAGARPLLTSIIYLEPENSRNDRGIGFDMYAEPVRHAAMVRAAVTGAPSLSGKVTLIQETETDVQPGTLLFMPTYKGDAALDADLRRQSDIGRVRAEHLSGFTFAAFRMRDLIGAVVTKDRPGAFSGVRLELFDGTETSSGELMFDSAAHVGALKTRAAHHAAPLHQVLSPLYVAGARWTLRMSSTPQYEAQIDWSTPRHLLGLGTLISALLAGITAIIDRARERQADASRVLAVEVAARRQAEEQSKVANRELVHRVKNSLAIVSSIASQTARHSKTLEEFIASFRKRIGELGRVHDMLRPDAAAAAEIHALFRDILAPYSADRAQALRLEGPHVVLRQNEAVLFSLLINELATNATKYGAWSVPTGIVTVTWELTPAAADGDPIMTLQWREAGGPPPDLAGGHTGFGSNVINFAVERAMRGSTAMTFPAEGAHHTFRIPWQSDGTPPFAA